MTINIPAEQTLTVRDYCGKELDRENGLDWYDFEARILMPDFSLLATQSLGGTARGSHDEKVFVNYLFKTFKKI